MFLLFIQLPPTGLFVHDLVLVIDAFHVYCIKVFCYKLFTETKFFALGKSPFRRAIVAPRLLTCFVSLPT